MVTFAESDPPNIVANYHFESSTQDWDGTQGDGSLRRNTRGRFSYFLWRKMIMKKILLTVLIIILIALPIGAVFYHYHHPTHWRYNDTFVEKSSFEEIQKRYGKFDFYNEKSAGYVIKAKQQSSNGEYYDILYYIVDYGETRKFIYKRIVLTEAEN